MEKITNIEIKNFKSIRHQTIEGCKRINVFVGPPNVGKSNVLEALSLFAIDREIAFSSFVRMENLTTLFHNGEVVNKSEVRVNNKHRVVANLEKSGIFFQEQFERAGTSFDKKDSGFIFSDESADVSTKRSFRVLLVNENAKNIVNYTNGSIGRANELPLIKRYEFFKRLSYVASNSFELSQPYGENIFSIISGNSNLKAEVQELFEPYNLELLYDSREQKFTILKRTDTGIFTIPYELVADTLQRLIFYKAANTSNKNSILLLEEPESHMFPPYISKFTSDIIHDENDNQFFIATHSPYVLNDLMEDAMEDLAIFLVDYKNGETLIYKMSDSDMHEAYQFGYDFFLNMKNFMPTDIHEKV